MVPVLAALAGAFPFRILGFHPHPGVGVQGQGPVDQTEGHAPAATPCHHGSCGPRAKSPRLGDAARAATKLPSGSHFRVGLGT